MQTWIDEFPIKPFPASKPGGLAQRNQALLQTELRLEPIWHSDASHPVTEDRRRTEDRPEAEGDRLAEGSLYRTDRPERSR